MAEFKPSPQQKRAIETEGSLLISAAAGSGKTTVLVRRVLRLLSDGRPEHTADRLMVVTFTVAAAAKLKGDLGHKLAAMAIEGDADTGLIKKQRRLLPRAAIGTFDSFCKNLCTEFFTKLAIEPDFRVGERIMLDVLEAEAMSSTLEQMLTDADFIDFCSSFANRRSLAEPQNAILMLHRRMVSQPFPENYLEKQVSDLPPSGFNHMPAGITLFDYAVEILGSAAKFLQRAVEFASEGAMAEKSYSVLCGERIFVNSLLSLAKDKDYSAMRRLFSTGPSGNGYATLRCGKGFETVKKLRDEAKSLVNKLYESNFAVDALDLPELCVEHNRMVAALCRATIHYHRTLTEAKREAACFDFYDLHHLTVQLLNMPELRIKERYFAVMVDEYQDTNPIADYIYHQLAENEDTELFMVGDVKQSIYGFNSARPDIFADRVENGLKVGGSHVVYLSENYRSSRQVIANVNDMFSLIMSKQLGGIDYDQNNRLYPGRQDSEQGSFELLLYEEEDKHSVASLCAELISQGNSPEDICILVQTNKEVSEYAAAVKDIGLMAELAGDKPISEEVGTMPLIALLRFIANPFSETDLIAVLLSPLGGFSADDVAKICMDRGGENPRRPIATMLSSQDERIKSFAELLWGLSVYASSVSVRMLLQHLYERLNAYVICSSMSSDAPYAIADIEELAVQYDKVGRNGITGFVRRMNLALSGRGRKKGESALRTGFVNIMTVHNSKGLEFPVCIAAGLDKSFNDRELSSPVLQQDRSSIGMKIKLRGNITETPFRRAAAIACREELMSERLRLLYVAATRAMNRLYIFVDASEKKVESLAIELCGEGGITPALIKRQNRFSDIITLFGLCNPNGGKLRGLYEDIPTGIELAEGNLTVGCVEVKPTDEVFAEDVETDYDLDKYRELFGWQYPNLQDTKRQLKYSVTELLNRNNEFKPTVTIPSFADPMYREREQQGAVRGSATHAFLQLCRLPLSADEVEQELLRLVDEGFMTEEEAKLVRVPGVKKYLSSTLSKRISVATELYREYEFIIEHDEGIVQGIVDLLFIEDGGVVIVDYKTTKGDDETLRKLYKPQLDLYAEALRRRLCMPIKEKIIYSLSLGREIRV